MCWEGEESKIKIEERRGGETKREREGSLKDENEEQKK